MKKPKKKPINKPTAGRGDAPYAPSEMKGYKSPDASKTKTGAVTRKK